MSPLQDKLLEILTSIEFGVRTAGDFAITQLPDIAQQAVLYGRVTATSYTAICFSLLGLALWLTVKFGYCAKVGAKYDPWPDSRITATVGGTAAICLTGSLAIRSLPSLFLVWLAPKVWLIKELATLVK